MEKSDIVIMGGGLAGLTLTRQLLQSHPDLKITILERNTFPVPEAGFKVGESTVEIASNYLEEVLNLKDYLARAQLPKMGLRYFFPQGDNSDIASRYEIGNGHFPKTPSYQLDRGRLENDLADMARAAGATLIEGCRITGVTFAKERGDASGLHEVTATRGDEPISVKARWVIDASGRGAIIKKKLGLKKEVGHKCNASWFRMDSELAIDAWSDDPAWQARVDGRRWFSTNHLMGKGYWVWFIPLSSGTTSVGVVTDGAITASRTPTTSRAASSG